jgi:hypothetical protein
VLILVEVAVLKKGMESPRYGDPVKFYENTGGIDAVVQPFIAIVKASNRVLVYSFSQVV